MKRITLLLLHSWTLIVLSAASDTKTAIIRRDLNLTELVAYDGYLSETHTVTTEDGYVLTIFRIKSSKCTKYVGTEPIIFQHGLFLSGADCIIPGPGGSHCYEYADACRDVWVPNSRGTFYSRKHIKLNPDKDPAFWDFSFDEMAQYDLPAVIDYVLKTTGMKKFNYVGHAQGVSLLLNLCIQRPEYNEKANIGFGLSTTAWLDNCKFIVIKAAGLLSNALTVPIETGVNAEFLPLNGFYQPFVKLLCGTTDLSYPSCSALYFSVLGNNSYQIPEDTFKVLTGHLPGGTSLKNFIHWGQIYQNGYRKYDHSILGNLKNYGRLKPPEYDVSKITMKWIFIGSENDYVSDNRDVNTLISKMSVKPTQCIVSDKTFGHLDYIYGKDIAELIIPMILGYLETGKFECL